MSGQCEVPGKAAAFGGHAAMSRTARAGDEQPNIGYLQHLGGALHRRTGEVVASMQRRSACSGAVLDEQVEQSFARVGEVSTIAIARWMSGEGAQAAREVGQESWNIFGQLAAQRAAPLNEVTKRCLRWRDAAEDVVREAGAEMGLPPAAITHGLQMVRRSLDVTLVRMCQSFESERQRAHEELSRRQDELSFMATHDPLTGLPNRTLIIDRAEQMLVRARRNQWPVAALFVDLDNFKSINDTLGHDARDELLCAVCARLRGVLRDIDAFGRLGGDEFAIVAEGMSLDAGPELIAQRLLEALSRPFELRRAESRLAITASIGIAAGDRICAEDLLRDADIAMYRAKWAGKNRYIVFETGMQDAIQSRMEMEMDLRMAFERDEFDLVYQPTFDLRRMVPTGMEALLRWHSPTRGLVGPETFVSLLEETGLIVQVGDWVLAEACRQGAAWRAAGHELAIAVNVSARQLDSDHLIASVAGTLADSGLPAGALTLEITETALMRNAEETAARLARLKELGVRIAIDDFGTGYSSLAYLQRFPVDALKIDRSFVSGMDSDAEGETLVRTLVSLGKSLAIETVAEGIERSDELSVLREESCDSGQGFLFARPLSVSDCERFLREWPGDRASAGYAGG